ncbi:helix-turn-helix transcriptional regulator [Actinorugispora endophytica]|uniref:Tetratricopeptide repeat protein n=1 Tax=Actinorugispora endophytica TaxID=1605990 RepID=A0A4V3D834_9ACTN|nr:LuxR family transcriptional regulator [Actinorugispora endophytica]TDQ50237.1 tetratricopeptide repeat protein [Actinorugispora endophytica]
MSSFGTSPVFVGRTAELRTLLDHARRVRTDGSTTVLLGGEAGVGKSRLLAEFAGRTATPLVLRGGCLELGVEGLPFAPFVAVLRQLLRARGALFGSAAGGAGEQELARLLPELGPPPPDRVEARGRLFGEILTLLVAAAADGGLSVVIEDLHWADSATRDLLVFLIRNLESAPVQIVAGYRSDDLHREHPLRRLLPELRRLPGVSHLDLGPLSRSEVAEQAAAISGRTPSPSELATLYERTGGFPLFVESFLEDPEPQGSVPAGSRDLLLRAARRLDERARAVLDVAAVGAVSGDQIDHRLLAAVAGLDEGALDSALGAAVDANILRVAEGGYAFRHSLLREAVHQELLPGRHARLHLRFAEALDAAPELVPFDRLAAEQAHHFHAAHELPRALGAAWRAAMRARESLAFSEELHMLERVLELWDRVDDAADQVGTTLADVVCQAAATAYESGEALRARKLCDEGLALLERVPDPDRETLVTRALLLRRRGRARIQLADHDGIDDLVAALDVHPPQDSEYGFLLAVLARELMMRGGRLPATRLAEKPLSSANTHCRFLSATELAEEALAHADTHPGNCTRADALVTLATLRGQAGDVEEALAMFDRAVKMSRTARSPELEARALGNLSSLLREHGRYAEAVATAREGIERARGNSVLRPQGAFLALNLAEAYYETGELARARETVSTGLDWWPMPLFRSFLVSVGGRIALARGDLAGAATAVDLLSSSDIGSAPRLQPMLSSSAFMVDFALAHGRVDEALAVSEKLDDDSRLTLWPSYSWPLVEALGRAARAAGPGHPAAARLRERLRGLSDHLAVDTPAHLGYRAAVSALVLEDAEPDAELKAWRAAAEAWAPTGFVLAHAEALLRVAEAAAAHGDRAEAVESLRAAAEPARRCGAEPLALRAADLARRLNASLGADGGAAPTAPEGLTPRELQVLRVLARGRTNAEIAAELFISAKTASVHVSRILGKLGVSNRGAAAARARDLGLTAGT